MAVSKLGVYNNALTLLGERKLATEFESRNPRYVLDEVWNLGAADYCLELSKPNFAQKTTALTSPAVSAQHALDQVYTLPAGFIALVGSGTIYSDNELQIPVKRYLLEGRTLATDIATTIYVRYITSTAPIGQWTPAFARLVAAYLAKESASRLNPSKIAETKKEFEECLAIVSGLESQNEDRSRPNIASITLDAHWLNIYNGALQILGEREVLSNADDSLRRIALDSALGASYEAVDACLELSRPRFATVVDKITSSSPGVEHDYTHVFTVAADYISILGLYQDAILDQPINRYFIEGRKIAANYSTIYLRYIQRDPTNANWTPAFKRLVSAYLAKEIAPQIIAERLGSMEPSSTYSTKSVMTAELNRVQAEYDLRLQYCIKLEGAQEPDPRPVAASVTLNAAWLSLYNTALEIAWLPPILSADDDSDRRRALDEAYNNDAVLTILTKIPWNNAYKTVKLEYDPDLVPAWGYEYVFAVPSDMERIDMLSTGEFFGEPYPDWYREGDYFYAGIREFYLRYISTSTMSNPTAWPTYFKNLVAAEFARRLKRIPGANAEAIEEKYEEYRSEAMSTDAQRNPPMVLSTGSWVGSRYSERTRRNGRP